MRSRVAKAMGDRRPEDRHRVKAGRVMVHDHPGAAARLTRMVGPIVDRRRISTVRVAMAKADRRDVAAGRIRMIPTVAAEEAGAAVAADVGEAASDAPKRSTR